MPSLDVDRVSRLLIEAAEIEILPRFRKLAATDIREKSPGELVTAADEAMERRLQPALLGLYPGSVMVGEESASADPAVLELLRGSDPVWLVDPLDGTANFAVGSDVFGSILSLVDRGETVAAWIYHPVSGRMLIAERGAGARLDGERVTLSRSSAPPLRASISTKFFPLELRAKVDRVRGQFLEREPNHCAAVRYTELVTGELDVAMYYRLMPWDHASGVLIHSEAGGFSTRFNGEPYNVAVHTGGLLLAPSEDVWIGLREALASG